MEEKSNFSWICHFLWLKIDNSVLTTSSNQFKLFSVITKIKNSNYESFNIILTKTDLTLSQIIYLV